MTSFDRYLRRDFLRVLLITLAGFVTVYLLVDIFDNIDTYIDRRAPLGLVITYYVYLSPFIIVLTLPMATLLASMLSVGNLARNNELVAMRTSGVSLYRLLLPLWVAGAVLSLGVIAVGGWVLPWTTAQARHIKRIQIERRPVVGEEPERNVVYQADDLVYHIGVLHPRHGLAERVGIIAEREGGVAWRLDGARGRFQDGCWSLEQGRLRVFSPLREYVASFSAFRSPLLWASPQALLRKPREAQELSVPELRRLIRRMRRSGLSTAVQEVELYLRFSFPLANLLMVLLGAPLASTPRRSGLALSFGISIAISFAYFGTVRGCQALGHHEHLRPLLAAWLPDVVFLGAGSVVLAKVRK